MKWSILARFSLHYLPTYMNKCFNLLKYYYIHSFIPLFGSLHDLPRNSQSLLKVTWPPSLFCPQTGRYGAGQIVVHAFEKFTCNANIDTK